MLATSIRPTKWEDIIGQDTIVKGLKNFLKQKNVPNCIVFAGSSGCGKNTIANLLSMCLQSDTLDENCNPNLECPSCKDILNERFSRDVHVYNGGEFSPDVLKEVSEITSYNAQFDENVIIVINECQLINPTTMKKLLEKIECNTKGVYWIFTSTDVSKFQNTYKDNVGKDAEKNAFRSRISMFTIKPISTNALMDFLFKLCEDFDPNGEKLTDVFFEEGITTIAEGSKNNLRQAINDFYTCVNSECFDRESIINLLNYEDEKKEYEQMMLLAKKDKSFLSFIQNFDDIESFFNYSWKILSDNLIRDVSEVPFKEEYKEKSYKIFKTLGTLSELAELYGRVNMLNNGYFRPSIYFTELYKYYKGNNKIAENTVATNSTPMVKKIKKAIKEN